MVKNIACRISPNCGALIGLLTPIYMFTRIILIFSHIISRGNNFWYIACFPMMQSLSFHFLCFTKLVDKCPVSLPSSSSSFFQSTMDYIPVKGIQKLIIEKSTLLSRVKINTPLYVCSLKKLYCSSCFREELLQKKQFFLWIYLDLGGWSTGIFCMSSLFLQS